mgnify:CR=1 FL=1
MGGKISMKKKLMSVKVFVMIGIKKMRYLYLHFEK